MNSQKQWFTEIGVERIRLVVTAAADARLEFLDDRGRPTLTLPPEVTDETTRR